MTPLVVLLSGADPRWLGSTVHTRNRRVASRAGVSVAAPADLTGPAERQAILVPAGCAVNLSLFPLPAPVREPVWLTSGAGRVLMGPSGALAKLLRRGALPANLPEHAVPADSVFDVSTRQARRRATRLVLRATGKATDGWVAQHCNRPISRVISRLLLACGLSAWHASGVTLLVGLAAAAVAAQPGPVALAVAGMLFHLASVVDGVDGEMARATLTESQAGARIDTVVDQTISLACLAGVAIGWVREGNGRHVLWWTVALAVVLGVSLVRSGLFVSRYAPNASFVFIDRSVRRAARTSTSVVLRGAAGAFTFLRRDVFAVIFMVVAFSGRRAWVPALVALGAAVANVTFAVYARELARAGAAEAASASGQHPAASVS